MVWLGALNHLSQSNHCDFSQPCPGPSPFYLVVLSNFTQSSRSPSRKKRKLAPESGKLFLFFLCLRLLPAGRRSTALRAARGPETMRGIFGTVIWGTHGIRGDTLVHTIKHSASGMDRKRQERRPECPVRHVSLRPLNTSARPAGNGPENESVWTEWGACRRSAQSRAEKRRGEERRGNGRNSSGDLASNTLRWKVKTAWLTV